MDGSSDAIEHQLAELASLLLSKETLRTTLQRVAEIAVRAIPPCDAASVTLAEQRRVFTAAATSPMASRVDEHQYAIDEGPCLEALMSGEPRRSTSLQGERRWPAFTPLALREGVFSVLSLPLRAGDGTTGALNMYSRDGPFTEHDEEVGVDFSVPVSAAIANAHAYAKAHELIEQLQQALQSRDVIGQAKGMIRARDGCSDEEAFNQLRFLSQHRNVKLRDIAQEMVDAPSFVLGGG